METKKMAVLLVLGIAVLAALYFILPGLMQPATLKNYNLNNVDVEVSELTNVSTTGVYWGHFEAPASDNVTCSNVTKNTNMTFAVEAATQIRAVSYETCYIKNNGAKINSEIIEMHDKLVAMEAVAETDRRNEVQTCCVFEGKESCSDGMMLYLCQTG
jgi:hypothetical protein